MWCSLYEFVGCPLLEVRDQDWTASHSASGFDLVFLTARDKVVFIVIYTLTIPLFSNEPVVPGWDPVNDRDGDGYVDDNELASLVNPAATARIRHESRAFTIGQMWSQRSSGCRTNVWDPNIATYISEYISKDWAQRGILLFIAFYSMVVYFLNQDFKERITTT